MMASTSTSFLLPGVPKSSSLSHLTVFSWRSQRNKVADIIMQGRNKMMFRLVVNATVSAGKGSSKKEVFMVDPLEAKRIAAKQMEEIRAREKLKRQRQIEAINGAWAMIGLTAGLVAEGQTGHGILAQLAGYLAAIFGAFFR